MTSWASGDSHLMSRADELEEVWSLFAEESREMLDQVEEALLKLEAHPTDVEQVSRLFRALHTFKGGARMMGLSVVESLAHHAEDLAALVRDEGVALTGEMVDLLLEALDRLRVMLDQALARRCDAEASEAEGLAARLESEVSRLRQPDEPADEAAPSTLPSVAEPALRPKGETEGTVEAERLAPRAAEAAMDPATDPVYVQIFLEMAAEELRRLRTALHALAGGDEGAIQEVGAVADTLQHAAGQMGYERLVAVLDDLMTAAEGPDGEARLDELQRVELALSEELALVQDNDRPAQESARRTERARETQATVSTDALAGFMETVGGLAATHAALHRVAERLVEVDLVGTVTRLVREANGDREHARREVQNTLGAWAGDLHSLVQVETEMGAALGRLRERALALRAGSAAEILDPLQRLVQDAARDQGKIVDLEMSGVDVELDRGVLDALAEPVRRLVLLAVTQGIEEPTQRREAGKPAAGCVSVVVSKRPEHVQVVVEDDGRGIDREIDLAGINAALQGRQGRLSMTSEPHQGTRFKIVLPLDMVVMDGMVVRVGGVRYVVPLGVIRRIVKPEKDEIVHSSADGDQSMLRIGGELVTIQTLRGSGQALRRGWEGAAGVIAFQDNLMLVVEKDEQALALPVDELIGQQQVFIRPLQGHLADTRGICGYALLGDGDVGMVLSLDQMYAQAGSDFS